MEKAFIDNSKKLSDTYERILNCAETLFARQGYDGTSTRQIASEAGISIQTLHYHCKSKFNLYKAVIERVIVPVTEITSRHIEEMEKLAPGDNEAVLKKFGMVIDDVFDEFYRNPNYPLLLFRQWLEQDSTLRAVQWDQMAPVFRLWAKKIEGRVGKDMEEGIDTQLLFLFLSWIYSGLFVNQQFIGDLLGIDPGSEEYIDRLKKHAKLMTARMVR